MWTITEPCLNREFPRGEQKNFHSLKIFVFLHGLITWRVMQRNVWNGIVSWQTRRRNNSTKYPLHASMTTTSKKKKCNVWENCHMYALKCFWNALDLMDLIVAVLGNTNQSNQARRDLCTNQREVRSTPHTIQKRKKSHGMIDDLDNVDFISSNVNSSHQEALLYVFENNEPVIKMIIKGRSPTMRHVSRTLVVR